MFKIISLAYVHEWEWIRTKQKKGKVNIFIGECQTPWRNSVSVTASFCLIHMTKTFHALTFAKSIYLSISTSFFTLAFSVEFSNTKTRYFKHGHKVSKTYTFKMTNIKIVDVYSGISSGCCRFFFCSIHSAELTGSEETRVFDLLSRLTCDKHNLEFWREEGETGWKRNLQNSLVSSK